MCCSLSNRWTVLAIDMAQLLELHTFNQYSREQFRHLKVSTPFNTRPDCLLS